MNIVVLNETLDYGGAAKIAKKLFDNLLQKEQHQVTFFYAYGNEQDDNQSNVININNKIQTKLAKVNRVLLGKQDGNIFKLDNRVKDAIKNADIVHIHNIHDNYISLKSLVKALKDSRCKVIWTLHDSWAFTGRCAVPYGCEGWKSGCIECDFKNYYPSTLVDRANSNLIKKLNLLDEIKEKLIFVSPSKWLMENVKESLLKDYKILLINNGVDTDMFKELDKNVLREKYNIKQGDKVALFVSANLQDPYKGSKEVITSIRENPEVRFLVVGKNSVELKRYNNVLTFDYISDERQMVELYNISDVLLTPYYYDNFPTTILESMSCGTNVIGLNRGGVTELIQGFGVLTEPKTFSEEVKNYFEKSYMDIDKQQIRNIAKMKFGLEIFTDKYLDLYREVHRDRK
ncbi:glycosyltransferase [Bacillus mobilis]